MCLEHPLLLLLGAMYQYEATSIAGFVQQLAVAYIGHGYRFYVTGRIPDRKVPKNVDAKLLSRYDIEISKWARSRRKRAELANVHYLRYGRFFILIATKGEHKFFHDEPNLRDVRRSPIKCFGYSISSKRGNDRKWHPCVRIHPDEYRKLKAYLLDLAVRRSGEQLCRAFRKLPFEPFAPIRSQYLNILRAVNRERAAAGLSQIEKSCVRLHRSPVRVFETSWDI